MMSLAFAALYLAGVNLATFIAFARDKRAAVNGEWRVKENTLLGLAAIGGSVGAFIGQRVFHHKTVKQPFKAFLILIAAAQVVALLALLIFQVRSALG